VSFVLREQVEEEKVAHKTDSQRYLHVFEKDKTIGREGDREGAWNLMTEASKEKKNSNSWGLKITKVEATGL